MRRAIDGVLAAAVFAVGALHLVWPDPFVAIVPPSLPAPRTLVLTSGVFEMLGGLGVMLPRTRRMAGVGLLLLFIVVFPANVHMALAGIDPVPGLPGSNLGRWARLPMQIPLWWWAWDLARTPSPPAGDRHQLVVAQTPLLLGALVAVALPWPGLADHALVGSTVVLTAGLLLATLLVWRAFEAELIVTDDRVVVLRGPFRWTAPRRDLRVTGEGHPLQLHHGDQHVTVRPEHPRAVREALGLHDDRAPRKGRRA